MKISVEELRAKAAKFNSRIRWRNVREQVAALVVIVGGAWRVWTTPHTVERIGYALMIVGAIYVMWHLWVWGSAKSLPADMGRADCVRFYQSELARQRDLARSTWKWGIGPMIPALALISIYRTVTAPPGQWWVQVVGDAGVLAAVIWVLSWLNLRAARRLDGRIKELDRELGGV